MSFDSLLAEGRLRPRKPRREDVRDLLRLVERDLADAVVSGLSADRRFLIAYEAALNLASVPLLCEGYETHGSGHHWLTFHILPQLLGDEYEDLAAYFESCRTKRNISAYDRGGEISETEAAELVREVSGFKSKVEQWVWARHPELT